MALTLFFRFAATALVLMFSTGAAAQTYKCVDAARKVTYSSTKCSEIGLQDAGEVRDMLNTSPAQKVSPAPAAPARGPAAGADRANTGAAAAGKPDEPERRCFTVKAGRGTATRCNDDPEEK